MSALTTLDELEALTDGEQVQVQEGGGALNWTKTNEGMRNGDTILPLTYFTNALAHPDGVLPVHEVPPAPGDWYANGYYAYLVVTVEHGEDSVLVHYVRYVEGAMERTLRSRTIDLFTSGSFGRKDNAARPEGTIPNLLTTWQRVRTEQQNVRVYAEANAELNRQLVTSTQRLHATEGLAVPVAPHPRFPGAFVEELHEALRHFDDDDDRERMNVMLETYDLAEMVDCDAAVHIEGTFTPSNDQIAPMLGVGSHWIDEVGTTRFSANITVTENARRGRCICEGIDRDDVEAHLSEELRRFADDWEYEVRGCDANE